MFQHFWMSRIAHLAPRFFESIRITLLLYVHQWLRYETAKIGNASFLDITPYSSMEENINSPPLIYNN